MSSETSPRFFSVLGNWETVVVRNTGGGVSWQEKTMRYVPFRHIEIAVPVEKPARDIQKTVSYMNLQFKKEIYLRNKVVVIIANSDSLGSTGCTEPQQGDIKWLRSSQERVAYKN